MSTSKTLLATIGLAAAFVTGCSSDADEPFEEGPTGDDTAAIRVIHLSADAPSVDVYVNGIDRAVTDLGFAEGTGFLEVPAGTYTFNIAPAGSSAESSVLDIEGLVLAPGGSYTAVAFDDVADLKAVALEEELSDVPSGLIRIRAVHVAAGVGEVDIWNLPASGEPARLYTDVAFGAVGEYLELPAAAYTVGFDVDDDAVPDLTFELPALPEQTVANLFAVNDGSVHLLAQLGDGSVARIDPRM